MLADVVDNPCEGAIWIDDFGYLIDDRFAEAGVIPVDTTVAPPGLDTDGAFVNVLLPEHLIGLDLEIAVDWSLR